MSNLGYGYSQGDESYDYSQGDDEGDESYALRLVQRATDLERELADKALAYEGARGVADGTIEAMAAWQKKVAELEDQLMMKAQQCTAERLRANAAEDQLRQRIAPEVADRSTIIEECARVCDLLAGLNVQGWGRKSAAAAAKCAAEIRALKPPIDLIAELKKAIAAREPQRDE